ncbi:MAG: 4a-hydroxytetrahydrobiopterin dehydratase [Myxococcaceae bacterium]
MAYDKTLLSPAHLNAFLVAHPTWKKDGEAIVRTYEAATFLEGIAFVQRVAQAAEEANHHPDIDIRYRKVRLLLTTHDAGGLTSRDIALAERADKLFGVR